ncbi:Peptidoglycan-binding domain 1 [hydrothermal vent metagenome]|uniref:Peptidoglycan-binding domain 1 n=1 Tax=hydrothermal vent metagenome TaxID=652676 RepID=A0A1W1CKJ9_9ZZZZ
MGVTLRIILLLTILYSSLWSTLLDQQLQSNLQYEKQAVKSLYGMNSNHPLWIGHAKNFHTLIDSLENPYYNYKDKRFYRDTIAQYAHLLQNNMNVNQNSHELAQLDIALTKSYIALANFIVKSDIDWNLVSSKLEELKETKDIKAKWEMVHKSEVSTLELFNAITDEKIDEFLKSITPLKKRHSQLIESLQNYRGMQDMPKIPYSKDFNGFKFGDIDDHILAIKKRLVLEGDFPKKSVYNEYFNKELMDAMQSYKSRYNLEQNNLIDKIMIYYMNKPIEQQVQSIIDNLDKLKVFPNRFPNEYILINIPDFTMDYYKDNNSILHMNAVIGRDKRPTPIFSSSMTHLVLNPTWNIPENLVRRDLIPTLMEEPDYMEKHNIHVFKGWKDKKEIKNFDISKLFPYKDESKGHIPYRFVQFPGDDNALGRIKFMFPNKYSVYLHDTDNKSLFARRYRVYSSGCMRIQKPFELLEALKPHLKKKDIKHIDNLRNSLKTATLRFTKAVPVQTAYFTVFSRNGLTYFRKDIYGYDKFIRESVIEENNPIALQ